MSKEFPVTVTLASGAKVRIGTAVSTEEGFELRLDGLSIGGTADAKRSRPSNGDFGGGGGTFPNYGRNQPEDRHDVGRIHDSDGDHFPGRPMSNRWTTCGDCQRKVARQFLRTHLMFRCETRATRQSQRGPLEFTPESAREAPPVPPTGMLLRASTPPPSGPMARPGRMYPSEQVPLQPLARWTWPIGTTRTLRVR